MATRGWTSRAASSEAQVFRVPSGVVVAAVGDASVAEGGEGDGVAARFGEEVAAEAEHVRPAAQ
jgi:hypothetical protein